MITETWNVGAQEGLGGVHGGAYRAVVTGQRGAVSTAHWLATYAGMRIMQDGGNAFDAAVAAAAAVSIAEPYMSGIGGSGGAVCYDAKAQTCRALDFHGTAPLAAVPERWKAQEAFVDGLSGALVPCVVAGWAALIEEHGTHSFSDVLQPAIELAEDGAPTSILASHLISLSAERLARDPAAASIFLPQGRPLQPGELFRQPQLANTLRTLAAEGPRSFYDGPIAQEIVAACAADGGLLTLEDLTAGAAPWKATASIDYRGYEVHTLAPPFGSLQVLETLGLLSYVGDRFGSFQSGSHLHTLIEAIKLARYDRVNTRPDSGIQEWQMLTSAEHLAALAGQIDPDRAAARGGEWFGKTARATARTAAASEHTTHLVTMDADGNLVSLTQTLGWLFGGAQLAGDTGVFLNDMCYWFDLDPDSSNVIGPGKQMASPIAPTVILDSQRSPWMGVGTPGGHGIPQTTVQMISNVIDFNLNPQSALEAPRIRVDEDRYVAMESRVREDSRLELAALGHECELVGEWLYEPQPGRSDIGRGAIVLRDADNNVVHAGADARGDCFALAW